MSRSLFTPFRRKPPYICPQCLHPRKPLPSPIIRRALHLSSRRQQQQQSIDLLHLLESRGFIHQIAGDRPLLSTLLSRRKLRFYAGVDPTAPSLHLGHLLPLMLLFWLTLHGHHAVSLVGGATARVGDPSGRLTARVQTAQHVRTSDAKAMFGQTEGLWRRVRLCAARRGWREEEMGAYEVLDNGGWLDGLGILDFLQTMGNGMRLGTMLGRDTVRNKMEKGDGMSFAEFTYPLLQAWDWWHMYNTLGVQVQIGGSDQYGNIVAGMDAVRYIAQTHQDANTRARWLGTDGRLNEELAPMGLTVPLLTTASGEKFGKSAGNAIWLDPKLTSPFDLYGFLLRSSDADVERYLNLSTFLPTEIIASTMATHNLDPGKRKAQHLLASEVLELVHGRDEALKTRAQHESLRNPTLASLSSASTADASQVEASSNEARIRLPLSLLLGAPSYAHVLFHAGLVASKSEGARLIAKGGVYVASVADADAGAEKKQELIWTQIKDSKAAVDDTALLDGLLMLRLGKWKVRVIEMVQDEQQAVADDGVAPPARTAQG